MDFLKLAQERYSCKKYDPEKAVPKEVLDKILQAGQLAPTAKNLQEQHVYVIQSEEGLRKIDELTPCRYGAPVVLLVAFDTTNVFTYPGDKYKSGVEDATIVATHLCLAATNAGIENCWLNFFDPDKAAEAMKLPESETVVLLMDFGYAAEGVRPTPTHEKTKPMEELVSYR